MGPKAEPGNNAPGARKRAKVLSATRRQKAVRLTAVLAAFVVFCTAWALMAPALTITQESAQPESGFFGNDAAQDDERLAAGATSLVAPAAPAGAAPLAAGDPVDPDAADPDPVDDRIYAVQITKVLVDESGTRIKSESAGTSSFKIYRSANGTADSVKDLNIGEATETPDYTGYDYQHDVSVPIGADGLGMSYDHDVSPGLYYIAEDPASIQAQIIDTSGQQWNYKQTYFLTEYAWRNHPNDNYMHVSQTYDDPQDLYASVPEYLGDHPSYSGEETFTNDYLEFYVYNVYEAPKVDVPVTKTWPDFDNDATYDWQATFKLQWAPVYPGETTPNVAFRDVTPLQEMTITKSQMAGESAQAASLDDRTFHNLPKYGTDDSGDTFRYQYSLEETSYEVTDATTGTVVYSWSKTAGYNTADEDTHYQSFYPHDAGEESADNDDYYIRVRNAKKNVREKETVDVTLDKQWDSTFQARDDTYFAEFELRRFAHTEYRDVSHMSEADRMADPVTVTILDANGTVVDALEAQPNVGVYLAGNFKGHEGERTATFETSTPVTLASGGTATTISAIAEGTNMSTALVRSQEFLVTQDTVFTITSGAENLITVAEGKPARVRDTAAGTNPLPDQSFSQTVRLDSTNNWHVDLPGLVHSVTSAGDDDDNENVTYYEYYLVEKESSPKGYAQYYLADGAGNPSETLYGDSDHQIETDAAIVAVNGPANRLVVEKDWRGVPDATGFPHVTFTLYQGWANGDGTVSPNSGDSWVYVNEAGESYRNIELPATSLSWICPEVLPTTKLDANGASRAVGYFVQEDENSRSGSQTNDGITASWQFYYYLNSNGKRTNAGHQGYFAGLTGASLAANGGTITICNKLNQYDQLLINKKFFELNAAGSWADTTASAARMTNTVLGFKVLRAVKTPDGKYIDDHGQVSDERVWMDYGDEMLVGFGATTDEVLIDNGNNDFHLENAGGEWHFRIKDNQDPGGGPNEQVGLPRYGFYVKNGKDVVVEYEYTYRETNVYKDLDRTPYEGWDWFSSVLPLEHNPIYLDRVSNEIANFQASDLLIHKQWIGDTNASEVYVKIWRTTEGGEVEDFTATIAADVRDNHNWQMYVTDESEIDVDHGWLVLKDDGSGEWTDALKVNRALLGSVAQTGQYRYYIEEVGYKTREGQVHTNAASKYSPKYDHMVDGNWTGSPAGTYDFAENAITIGGRGENQLKVINSTAASTSYRVSKAFSGTHGATGAHSSVTDRYPTDGSAQATIQLQQRYRYEKTEGGVDYVSADNTTWVRADSAEAASTWAVDWQAAESAHPGSVTLPLPKPAGSTLSDEAWYGSAAAWSYTWENLDLTKVISQGASPEDTVSAQLYYRAVETSTPEWMTAFIAEDEINGHKAVDDGTQSIAQILSEKNTVTNMAGQCNLKLNKEWTGLSGEDPWPEGYVVSYQLVQHFHLAGLDASGEGVYGATFKSADMQRPQAGEAVSDAVHPQATGTLEKSNHNLSIMGLPAYGFYTATADDVAAAAEAGVELTAGVTYPVVYTYSAKETAVTKNGTPVDFKAQTVAAERDTTVADGIAYEATLTNEVTGITIEKKWERITAGPDESARIGLYRFEREPEPVPETTFTYAVTVEGDEAALESAGSVSVTVFDEDDAVVGTCELGAAAGWSHEFELEVGKTYHATFVGDGEVLEAAVTPSEVSGISEAGSVQIAAAVKQATVGSVSLRITGSPSGLWINGVGEYESTDGNLIKNIGNWNPSYFSGPGSTAPMEGLEAGKLYGFQLASAPTSISGVDAQVVNRYGSVFIFFTPASGEMELVLDYGGNARGIAANARMRTLAEPTTGSLKAPALQAAPPLRAPASITWINDRAGLPEGADPETDTIVEEVSFSGVTWSQSWDDLPKYAANGNEYVYYAYEIDYTGAAGATEMTTTYSDGDDGTLVVTNTPTIPEEQSFDLNILKVDENDADTKLDGATFVLHRLVYDAETSAISYEEGFEKTVTTADGGKALFDELSSGYYEVKETGLPNGYVLVGDGAFCVKVSAAGIDLVKREADKAPSEWQVVSTDGPVTFAAEDETYTATVANEPGSPLPHTGGPGVVPLMLLGVFLIVLALAMSRGNRAADSSRSTLRITRV